MVKWFQGRISVFKTPIHNESVKNSLFKVILCTVFIEMFGYNCYLFQGIGNYNDK